MALLSPGTLFLLTEMLQELQTCSMRAPSRPRGLRSTSTRWLSVPPVGGKGIFVSLDMVNLSLGNLSFGNLSFGNLSFGNLSFHLSWQIYHSEIYHSEIYHSIYHGKFIIRKFIIPFIIPFIIRKFIIYHSVLPVGGKGDICSRKEKSRNKWKSS